MILIVSIDVSVKVNLPTSETKIKKIYNSFALFC